MTHGTGIWCWASFCLVAVTRYLSRALGRRKVDSDSQFKNTLSQWLGRSTTLLWQQPREATGPVASTIRKQRCHLPSDSNLLPQSEIPAHRMVLPTFGVRCPPQLTLSENYLKDKHRGVSWTIPNPVKVTGFAITG